MRSKRHIISSALAIVVACVAGVAQGAIIFQDDFSGAGADLHGTTPDVTTGGATWTAHANIDDDGSLVSAAEGCTAWLPFVPEAGKVYTLSADLDNTGDWVSVGFGQGAAVTARTLGEGAIWALIRQTGSSDADVAFYNGTSNSGNSSTTSAAAATITLDTTAADWVAKWYFDGSLERTLTITAGYHPGITHVFLSSTSGASGTYDNFQLEVIPEPATLGLFAIAGGGVLWIRRRRNV